MTCIKCGTALPPAELLEMSGEFRGERVTIKMTAAKCPSCGRDAITGSQMAEFSLKVADAYREMHNLLTSSQIRTARQRLGMSQRKFAEYLGVGIASLKRWELGEIQTRTFDELIRLKTDITYVETLLDQLYQRVATTAAIRNRAASQARESRQHEAPSHRGDGTGPTDCETLAA